MNTDKQYNPIELSKEYLEKTTLDNQSISIGIIVIMCAPGGHISSMSYI